MHIGMTGEFRCVIERADGSIKIDTGFQKNLILDQGLDFFGGGHGTDFFYRCIVGSGNSTPDISQVKLDLPVKIASGVLDSENYAYTDNGDGLYKIDKTYRYVFSTAEAVNISEVGLASDGGGSINLSNHYLCTRALIKDADGNPTTISILETEKLRLYYKVAAVFSTLDTSHVINLLDGAGGSKAYNVTCRLALAGSPEYKDYMIGKVASERPSNNYYRGRTFRGELGAVKGEPSNVASSASSASLEPYIAGSFKRQTKYEYALSDANGNTRCINAHTSMGSWQMRYGSVEDDSPLTKSNQDTMTVPIEMSWGRYEGVLE